MSAPTRNNRDGKGGPDSTQPVSQRRYPSPCDISRPCRAKCDSPGDCSSCSKSGVECSRDTKRLLHGQPKPGYVESLLQLFNVKQRVSARIRKCQIYLPNPRARAITVFSPGSAQVLCFYELESRSRNDKIPNLSVTIRKNRSELDAETSSRGHDWKDSPTSERPTGTWYRGRSNVRAIRGHCYAMVSKRQCCAISSQARPFTTGKIPSMARRGRWSCLLALSFAANRSWRHETPQCSYRCRWTANDLRPWTGSSCGRRLFFVFFWRRVQQ